MSALSNDIQARYHEAKDGADACQKVIQIERVRGKPVIDLYRRRDNFRSEMLAYHQFLAGFETSFVDDPLVTGKRWGRLTRAFPGKTVVQKKRVKKTIVRKAPSDRKLGRMMVPAEVKALADDAIRMFDAVEYRYLQDAATPSLLLGYRDRKGYVLATWGKATGLTWDDIAAIPSCQLPRLPVRFVFGVGVVVSLVGVLFLALLANSDPTARSWYESLISTLEGVTSWVASILSVSAESYQAVRVISGLALFLASVLLVGAVLVYGYRCFSYLRARAARRRVFKRRPHLKPVIGSS